MSTPTPKGASSCDPQAVAEFLRALAHPMRLSILCRLLEGECAVSGFETELGLKQPNLSQQLSLLREAGLVATRRESKSMVYRLADERVETVMAALKASFGAGAAPASEAAKPPTATSPSPQLPAQSLAKTASVLRAATPAGAECGVFSTAGWPVP